MDIDRQKAFLYTGTILVGAICFLMISPYIGYLLSGILLAFISYPLFEKLNARTRSDLSALIVIGLTVFAAILPFTIMIGAVGNDAADLVSNIDRSNGLEIIDEIEQSINRYTGQTVDLEQQADDILNRAASILPSSLSSTVGILSDIAIGLSLMLFAQFYALKDGKSLVHYSKRFDFMDNEKQEFFYNSTAASTWAVVKGHVLIAFIQGILAGIGLYLVGIPNSLFWTFVMILTGFIPIIGTALVWAPAAIYLAITGQLLNALILTAYGLIIVSAADNILRPLTVDKDADIHPIFILIGLIGGIGIFGPVGIFLGPVIFGILKNFLDTILETQ